MNIEELVEYRFLRQEGYYLDFKRLEKDDVYPFLKEVELFFSELKKLLDLN